jgi:hypothetical protein
MGQLFQPIFEYELDGSLLIGEESHKSDLKRHLCYNCYRILLVGIPILFTDKTLYSDFGLQHSKHCRFFWFVVVFC